MFWKEAFRVKTNFARLEIKDIKAKASAVDGIGVVRYFYDLRFPIKAAN